MAPRSRGRTRQPSARRPVKKKPPPEPSNRNKPSRDRKIRGGAIALIALGAAILVYPFLPLLRYELFHPAPVYPYQTKLSNLATGDPLKPVSQLPDVKERQPTDSRLVIPKIGVNIKIVEGGDESALYRGSWHIPNTSTPPQGGNTVLTVHRFQYLAGPNTLALADKLEVGDVIIVYWKTGADTVTEYDYRITETKLVQPNQVEILNNTPTPRLTVFTCAPMFSTKQRLVLIAEPI